LTQVDDREAGVLDEPQSLAVEDRRSWAEITLVVRQIRTPDLGEER
jgi:hypothetical protein